MRVEDLFRTVNDRIAEKGTQLGWRFPGPFFCECNDPRCFAQLDLTLEAYLDLRSHPHRYLTAPGHEIAEAVVIERNEGFALAEKPYADAAPLDSQ